MKPSEIEKLVEDDITFDELLKVYKRVFGENVPDNVANSFGFIDEEIVLDALYTGKPIRKKKVPKGVRL
tara:strand:+ start:748 stop:954 length:207 start_codon:yes stop_codon:yes gene_type:complete